MDEDWKKCWIDSNNQFCQDNSFYRSTLVVPITLVNNKGISREFLRHIELPLPTEQDDKRRAIYGFLCFDSIYPGFFDEADVHVGYFFADIFSFYLVPLHIAEVDYSVSDNGAFMSTIRRLRDERVS